MKGLITVLLIIYSGAVLSAETYNPIEVYCGKMGDGKPGFVVTALETLDDAMVRAKNVTGKVYDDYAKHKIECTVNSHKVSVEFENIEPLGRGQGGACRGAELTVAIDNEVFLEKTKFGGCEGGLTTFQVSSHYYPVGTNEIVMCGHTSGPLPLFDGCIRFHESQMVTIKKPISGWYPMVGLIKVLFR